MTPHRVFRFCRGVQSVPAGCCRRVGLSRVNAERAADYSRIDIRVDCTFTNPRTAAESLLRVQNAIDRRNFASDNWNPPQQHAAVRGAAARLPILGFDWRL